MDRRDIADDIQRSKAEAGYRLLLDRHPVPMWVFDLETLRFLAVNQAAITAYGHSKAAFQARSLADIRPATEVPVLMAFLADPQPDLSTARRWRHCQRSGELIDVEVVSEAVEFAGRPARLLLANDITSACAARPRRKPASGATATSSRPPLKASGLSTPRL